MSRPDLNYLASLVAPIREGDMNAFAELYAATCQKQYSFALDFLKKEFDARTVLEEVYITALRAIPGLRDDSLIAAMLTNINFRVCLKKRAFSEGRSGNDPESEAVTLGSERYTIRRLLGLPYTEGQSILLTCYCNMPLRNAANLLEMSPRAVRYYIANGKMRLLSEPGGGEVQ